MVKKELADLYHMIQCGHIADDLNKKLEEALGQTKTEYSSIFKKLSRKSERDSNRREKIRRQQVKNAQISLFQEY